MRAQLRVCVTVPVQRLAEQSLAALEGLVWTPLSSTVPLLGQLWLCLLSQP